jgi:hypothetical protein
LTPPFFYVLADVQSTAIGAGTRVGQFVAILPVTQSNLHR